MIIESKSNKYFRCSCRPRTSFGKCNNLDHPLKLEWLSSSYQQYIECWALGKYTIKDIDIVKLKLENKTRGRAKYGGLIYDYKYLESDIKKNESISHLFESVEYFIRGYFPKNYNAFNAVLPIPPTTPKKRTIPFDICRKLESHGLIDCKKFIEVTDKDIKPSKELKTKPEKIANLEGKFIVGDPRALNGVTGLLVIDDVYEQGATADVILNIINLVSPDIPKYFLAMAYLD